MRVTIFGVDVQSTTDRTGASEHVLERLLMAGAAICLVRTNAHSRSVNARRLTARTNGAQHTEKASVFYYSKVKEDDLLRPARQHGIVSSKLNRNAVASHLSGNEPHACWHAGDNE
jgi:hypothetical protein